MNSALFAQAIASADADPSQLIIHTNVLVTIHGVAFMVLKSYTSECSLSLLHDIWPEFLLPKHKLYDGLPADALADQGHNRREMAALYDFYTTIEHLERVFAKDLAVKETDEIGKLFCDNLEKYFDIDLVDDLAHMLDQVPSYSVLAERVVASCVRKAEFLKRKECRKAKDNVPGSGSLDLQVGLAKLVVQASSSYYDDFDDNDAENESFREFVEMQMHCIKDTYDSLFKHRRELREHFNAQYDEDAEEA